MDSLLIAVLVFGLVYGGAFAGAFLQRMLPDQHRDAASKEVVHLVMGLIGTMAALVLGLLIASTHTFFETQQEEVQKLSGDVILLDEAFARYGPETWEIRHILRADIDAALQAMSPEEGIGSASVTPLNGAGSKGHLLEAVQALEPKTAAQRFDQSKALDLMATIASTRLLIHEQATNSVATPLIVVMVLWLTLLFVGFCLFAQMNATVMAAVGFGAFSVAAAIFLILDMSHPYRGLVHVSSEPFRNAVDHIDR